MIALDPGFDLASCFSADYAEARARFLAAAREAGGSLRAYPNPNAGPRGEALACDVAWIGPSGAKRVLALQSATHGVECFAGSAAILGLLRAGAARALPSDVALLLIHAINPWGFAWIRRTTEEGVDLNRNFVDFSAPLPENPGHDALVDAFVPRAISGPDFEAAEARIAAWRARHGETAFRVARSGGQYRHGHSFFFGGAGPTWARRTLEALIDDHDLAAREEVGVIDYHTGLGPFGFGDPLCSQQADGAARTARLLRRPGIRHLLARSRPHGAARGPLAARLWKTRLGGSRDVADQDPAAVPFLSRRGRLARDGAVPLPAIRPPRAGRTGVRRIDTVSHPPYAAAA